MKSKVLAFTILLAACVSLSAQSAFTTTTLSSAISTPSAPGQPATRTLIVASATGITAGASNPTTYLYIDRELMLVNTVSGTTIGVTRGVGATNATPHASAALVWVGPGTNFVPTRNTSFYAGPCTPSASGAPSLPIINTDTGQFYSCVGGTSTALTGKWVTGVGVSSPKFRSLGPDPGGTAYTSLNTNGTTLGITTLYCTEVYLPANKLLTGIGVLAGTTVGTDKWYAVLYAANGGTALANSALAGTTTATASTYQALAFTSQYYALAGDYFACFQTNGTTDTARMTITGVADNILTKGQTGATFGTVPSLTVPTTFTTAVGAYVYLY